MGETRDRDGRSAGDTAYIPDYASRTIVPMQGVGWGVCALGAIIAPLVLVTVQVCLAQWSWTKGFVGMDAGTPLGLACGVIAINALALRASVKSLLIVCYLLFTYNALQVFQWVVMMVVFRQAL